MLAFHRDWAFVVIVLNLVAGAWGLVLFAKRRAPRRAFWIALLAGQAALATQVAVGVALFQHRKPHNRLHPFYGFMLLFAAVASLAFRGEAPRRALLVVASVALFVGIVSVRATLTGFR